MKEQLFTEEQIIAVLKEQEAGSGVPPVSPDKSASLI